MALVRISRDLLTAVKDTIKEFADQIRQDTVDKTNPSLAAKEYVGGDIFDYCDKKAWGEHYDLKGRLVGTRFCKQVSRYDLSIRDQQGKHRIEIQVRPSEGKVNIPSWMGSWDYCDLSTSESDVSSLPWVSKFFADKEEYDILLAAHNTKFANIRDQVIGFLNASKSLNDAIKKYPDIKLWIPKRYIDDVERVVDRKPREQRVREEMAEAVVDLDTSLLASMGVMRAIVTSA